MMRLDIERLKKLAYNPVRDYVIPGLTSSLMGKGNGGGVVRLFSQERDHEEPITPHSHRFDFQCLVLRGSVRNRIWLDGEGDIYQASSLNHHPGFGSYDVNPVTNPKRWDYEETKYSEGDVYAMNAEQIHSIYFSRGAEVLFFEEPNRLNHSFVLEPMSNGRVIPTFRVDSWMFKREETPA